MINQEKIAIVTDKLVEVYNPESIFLFGSYAWGTPTKDSDLDIMIVINSSNDKSYIRPRKGFKALRGMKISKDIIVYTKNELKYYLNQTTTLPYKILKEGISLYERS